MNNWKLARRLMDEAGIKGAISSVDYDVIDDVKIFEVEAFTQTAYLNIGWYKSDIETDGKWEQQWVISSERIELTISEMRDCLGFN